MDDMCTACLCTGRHLYFIAETGFYHLYSQILNEIPVYDFSEVSVRICWECCHMLRRFCKFKALVKSSYSKLLQQLHQNIPSSREQLCRKPSLRVHGPVASFSSSSESVKAEANGFILVDQEEFGDSKVKIEPREIESVEEDCLAHEIKGNNLNEQDVSTAQHSAFVPSYPDPVKDESDDGFEVMMEDDEGRWKSGNSSAEDEANDEVKVNDLKKHRKHSKKKKERTTTEKSDRVKFKKKVFTKKQKVKKKKANMNSKKVVNITDGISDNKCDDLIGDEGDKSGDEVLCDMRSSLKDVSNGVAEKKKEDSTPELVGGKFKCPECGKLFSSKKTYRYHLNTLHKGQNTYPCPRCNRVYQWKSNLGRHMRTHKAVDSGELFCASCDKRFASLATLRQHLRGSRTHVAEGDYRYICNECGQKFVSKTRLRDHVDWEHLHRYKFRCTQCDKAFKCHTSLYLHKQNVHRDRAKGNLCHVCGKSYHSAAKLRYHIVAMHTSETPYSCPHCRATFSWYSSLYRHIREVHHKIKEKPKTKVHKTKRDSNSVPLVLHDPTLSLHPPGIVQ